MDGFQSAGGVIDGYSFIYKEILVKYEFGFRIGLAATIENTGAAVNFGHNIAAEFYFKIDSASVECFFRNIKAIHRPQIHGCDQFTKWGFRDLQFLTGNRIDIS